MCIKKKKPHAVMNLDLCKISHSAVQMCFITILTLTSLIFLRNYKLKSYLLNVEKQVHSLKKLNHPQLVLL